MFPKLTMVPVLLLLSAGSVHADLFDDARKAVQVDIGRADSTGVSIRGGAGLRSGAKPTSATLLRGNINTGGT
jgi:hypothetical protein